MTSARLRSSGGSAARRSERGGLFFGRGTVLSILFGTGREMAQAGVDKNGPPLNISLENGGAII